MKVFNLLPLLAAGIVAAPAPSSDFTASSPSKIDDMAVAAPSKNYSKYNFQVSINQYCDVDTRARSEIVQPELRVYGEFVHNNRHQYDWDITKGSTKTFLLDNTDILVHYDFDTSETSFEHGDCKWKGSDTANRECGWCDEGILRGVPERIRQIDCSARSELSRHRTITCYRRQNLTIGRPSAIQLNTSEQEGVAAIAGEASALVVGGDDVATSLGTSRLKARGITDDGKSPENLYRFGVTHSEWCENGALKARGWMSGHELNFYKDVTQKIPINLHPGRDLLFGPYSYDQHAFGVEYAGCVWTSEGGWPCGWCEVKAWTSGPLDCQTLQPGYQRTSYRTCYFVDNHMNGKARRAIEPSETSLTLPDDATFSLLAPPIITSPPQFIDVTPPESNDFNGALQPTPVIAGASTLTLMPAVIKTVLPNTPKGTEDTISPFHIQVWEYCFSGSRLAAGVWTNGNMAQSLNFTDSKVNPVSHRVPGFAPYYSVDFNYETSRVQFGYPWTAEHGSEGACKWFDNESWKSCGECREKLWSSGPLDCEDPRAVGVRVKDMDCSLLLVPKQRFKLDPSGAEQ